MQTELKLTFADNIDAEAEAEMGDFWTTARSGEFVAEDLAEAEESVMALSAVKPLRSRIELVNPN